MRILTSENQIAVKKTIMKYNRILLFLLIFPGLSFAQTGKLYLIAGQSNAAGQGTSTLSTVCNTGTAFEFNGSTNSIQALHDPMGQTVNNLEAATTGSVGPAFAKKLNDLTGNSVYLVSAARKGASCCAKAELSTYGTWDDSGNLMIFGSAVSKVNSAIKKTGLPLSGIIWIQGERDANAIGTLTETEAEYKASLIKVISRFRTAFGPKVPFYIVLIGLQGVVTNGIPVATATDANYTVRRIQMEVAQSTPNVFIAYTSTDTFFDKGWMKPETTTVHYIQPAYNQIGDSVAQFVSKIKYDTIANIDTTTYVPNMNNPHVIVDNTDTGCTFDAPWTISTYTTGYYGSNYMHDGSATANPEKWAKWTPNLPQTGSYRVYMQYAGGAGRPTAAPVEIQSADKITQTTIDQTINSGKWNYLGTYNFNFGTSGYVKLSGSCVGSTIADAVLFEQILVNGNVTPKQNNANLKVQGTGSDKLSANFELTNKAQLSLDLFNCTGEKIRSLINNQSMQSGAYNVVIDKSTLTSGLYFLTLRSNGMITETVKFIMR